MSTGLGYETAVGLLAGPEELQRLRRQRRTGLVGQLWRRFQQPLGGRRPEDQFQLVDLALMAAVTGEAEWAAKARQAALHVAHLPLSSFIDFDAGCMSLMGMHKAHGLCLAADWLWPVLNRDQREAVIGALVAKCVENLRRTPEGLRDELDGKGQLLLARRLDRDDPFCLHPLDAQVNNWDLWFSGALYMAARLAERVFLAPDPATPPLRWGHYYDVGYELDAARIARWKSIALERIHTAVRNQVGAEGDYAEGISYADYGGTALIVALTAIERGGEASPYHDGVARIPAWRRNQVVTDLTGGSVNFNDAKLGWKPALSLVGALAARTGDPQTQAIFAESWEAASEAPGALVLIGATNDVEPAPVIELAEATAYPHTGMAIWRPPAGEAGVFVAMQSGAHGGAHQHRDRNNLFVSAFGEHLLVDTGDCRYLQPPDPTFCETVAHNCLLIDGEGQFGDNQNPVGGALVEHRHQGGVTTALMDASACYPQVANCRRRVVFQRPGLVVVADTVSGEARRLTWLAQGYNPDGAAAWEGRGRHLVLRRPGADLHIYFAEEPQAWRVQPGPLDGETNGILRLAADFPAPRILAVLAPVAAGQPEPSVTWTPDGLQVDGIAIAWHDDAVAVAGQTYSL